MNGGTFQLKPVAIRRFPWDSPKVSMDSWRNADFGDFDDFPRENPLEKLLLDIETIDEYRIFFGSTHHIL